MKYIRYVNILLWTLIRKAFGLVWFYVAVPFRAYARNTVYNYVLQNDLYLKRLLERPISRESYSYYTIKPFHGTDGGTIEHRKVSWLEYQLVYWFIWGWLDDDANQDTTDKGYIQTIVNGERLEILPGEIEVELIRDLTEFDIYGNSFDLGDKRAKFPIFEFWSSTLWNIRNTAYNFKYMQWEEERPEYLFYHKIGNYEFGYNEDGRLVFGKF